MPLAESSATVPYDPANPCPKCAFAITTNEHVTYWGGWTEAIRRRCPRCEYVWLERCLDSIEPGTPEADAWMEAWKANATQSAMTTTLLPPTSHRQSERERHLEAVLTRVSDLATRWVSDANHDLATYGTVTHLGPFAAAEQLRAALEETEPSREIGRVIEAARRHVAMDDEATHDEIVYAYQELVAAINELDSV